MKEILFSLRYLTIVLHLELRKSTHSLIYLSNLPLLINNSTIKELNVFNPPQESITAEFLSS